MKIKLENFARLISEQYMMMPNYQCKYLMSLNLLHVLAGGLVIGDRTSQSYPNPPSSPCSAISTSAPGTPTAEYPISPISSPEVYPLTPTGGPIVTPLTGVESVGSEVNVTGLYGSIMIYAQSGEYYRSVWLRYDLCTIR